MAKSTLIIAEQYTGHFNFKQFKLNSSMLKRQLILQFMSFTAILVWVYDTTMENLWWCQYVGKLVNTHLIKTLFINIVIRALYPFPIFIIFDVFLKTIFQTLL